MTDPVDLGLPDDDPGVRQDAEAGRDAYVAARDVVIHRHGAGAELGAAPGLVHRRVWGDVPARNPGFTGRGDLLATVRQALVSGGRAAVQALHGRGGVGKTQLAAEYAYRFADNYEVVWWIAAERAGLIEKQVAGLAAALSCAPAGAGAPEVRRAVAAELRERGRWLLVFDNADNADAVSDWLPGGAGHVLITSRAGGWEEVAVPVAVDVLARDESVALLTGRVLGLAEADADRVAATLGDLPLALAQAARHMTGTDTTAAEYLGLLAARAGQMLDPSQPSSYPRSLSAVNRPPLDADRLTPIISQADVPDETAAPVHVRPLDGSSPQAQEWYKKYIQEYADQLASESARQEASARAPGARTTEITESVVIRARQSIEPQTAKRQQVTNFWDAAALAGTPILSGGAGAIGTDLHSIWQFAAFAVCAFGAVVCIYYQLRRRLL